jgi:hypothetical protein
LTTDFQGRTFSSHKSYILDPGGSATTTAQKFGFCLFFTRFKKIYLLNDSTFSPVGSGLTKAEETLVRPRGSLEEIILNSEKETKIIAENENFTIVIDIPTKLRRNMQETTRKTRIYGKIRPRITDVIILVGKIG